MGKKRPHPETAKKTPSDRPKRSIAALACLQPRALRLLLALALFFAIAGARWWLIGKYGSDVPWLDQWDAEAQGLYQPWHNGTLTLESWFAPHNEHRILFTRILVFVLLLINGQWDPRLQMVANAMLYAGVASGLFFVLSKEQGSRFMLFFWAVLAVLFTFPYGSTNTLLGFQSQFYFLTVFSLVAIYTLLNSQVGSWPWVAGILCGGAALLSMGSGIAAPLVTLGVLFLLTIRSWRGWRESLREKWMIVAVACALIAAGFYLRVNPPHHIPLRAQSVSEFAQFLLACFSWPGKPMTILALITWLPYAIFLAYYALGKTKDGPLERFVLGMGLWVLLQASALAFFRGHSEEGLESRYTDILSFGLIANILCAAWLIDRRSKRGTLMLLLTIVWFTVNGAGLYAMSFNGALTAKKTTMEFRRAQTAGFVTTEDVRFLEGRWLPYYDPKRFGTLLQDPAIQPILPVGIRKSLPLMPAQGSPLPAFTNLSRPDIQAMAPDLWNWTGIFSRFAVISSRGRFEYHIVKNERLPFLLLYFFGNRENLSIVDSEGVAHTVILLPSNDDRESHHAFVYCPTKNCVIAGVADKSSFAFMEPKEIGPLSIFALIAGQWGYLVFGVGVALFFVALALLVLGDPGRSGR